MVTRFKLAFGAALATAMLASPALAAPLNATFTIDFYNFDAGGVRDDTFASEANLVGRTVIDTFTYTGPLDFRIDTRGGPEGGVPSVADFFATGGGTFGGLDVDLSTYDLSSGGGSGDPSWGRTTILDISASISASYAGDIVHDDGVTLFADGVVIADSAGPTTEKTTSFFYSGSAWRLIYAAANGDPSILEVDGPTPNPIPLPPAGLLLMAGFGGLSLVARRRKHG
jgi:hypothetical protein